MKNLNNLIALIVLLLATIIFAGMSHSHSHSHRLNQPMKMKPKSAIQELTAKTQAHQLSSMMAVHVDSMYSNYLSISNALAQDDFAKAKIGVMNIIKNANKLPDHKKKEVSHSKILGLIHSLRSSTEIEELRSHFEVFSKEFIQHMKPYEKSLSQEFKVFYCPMKKAIWVQASSQAKNPYYGRKMLQCGGEQK